MGPSDLTQLEKGVPGGVLCGQETPVTSYRKPLGSSPGPASEAPSSEGQLQGWVGGTGSSGSAGYKQTLSPVLAYLLGEHCQALMR